MVASPPIEEYTEVAHLGSVFLCAEWMSWDLHVSSTYSSALYFTDFFFKGKYWVTPVWASLQWNFWIAYDGEIRGPFVSFGQIGHKFRPPVTALMPRLAASADLREGNSQCSGTDSIWQMNLVLEWLHITPWELKIRCSLLSTRFQTYTPKERERERSLQDISSSSGELAREIGDAGDVWSRSLRELLPDGPPDRSEILWHDQEQVIERPCPSKPAPSLGKNSGILSAHWSSHQEQSGQVPGILGRARWNSRRKRCTRSRSILLVLLFYWKEIQSSMKLNGHFGLCR